MLFLALSKENVKFIKLRKLIQRFYTTTKILPIISQIKFINKRKFAKAVLNKNSKIFVMYIAALEIPIIMPIYFLKTFQV